MNIVVKDNWEFFSHNRRSLYHVTTTDRLDSIKKFGLNPVISQVLRRGDANIGGVYLSKSVLTSVEVFKREEPNNLNKLILFEVPRKNINMNNLYIDLEYIFDTAVLTHTFRDLIDFAKRYPCKYDATKQNYRNYINYLVDNMILVKNVFNSKGERSEIKLDKRSANAFIRCLKEAECFYYTNTIPFNQIKFLGKVKELDRHCYDIPDIYTRKDYVQ